MMAGADLPAVQRIMRHTDPRITTEFYGHLAPGYLRKAIDRLAFEDAAQRAHSRQAVAAAAPREPAVAAQLIPEFAAPLLQTRKTGRPRAIRRLRRSAENPLLDSVGARGFEPPTFCSQNDGDAVTGVRRHSQPSRTIGLRGGTEVQRSEV